LLFIQLGHLARHNLIAQREAMRLVNLRSHFFATGIAFLVYSGMTACRLWAKAKIKPALLQAKSRGRRARVSDVPKAGPSIFAVRLSAGRLRFGSDSSRRYRAAGAGADAGQHS
jgi:hypothetical protein